MKKIFTGPNKKLSKCVGLVLRVALPKKWVIGPVNPLKMSNFWVIFRPNNSIFWKLAYKSNPTYLLNFLFDPVKKNCMAKFGQIVAKYDPNLAKFGLTDLSYPWNSLIFIQNPSNGIKRTFLYAEFLRIPYGPSEWRVCYRLNTLIFAMENLRLDLYGNINHYAKTNFFRTCCRALRCHFFRYQYDTDTFLIYKFDTDTILILSWSEISILILNLIPSREVHKVSYILYHTREVM